MRTHGQDHGAGGGVQDSTTETAWCLVWCLHQCFSTLVPHEHLGRFKNAISQVLPQRFWFDWGLDINILFKIYGWFNWYVMQLIKTPSICLFAGERWTIILSQTLSFQEQIHSKASVLPKKQYFKKIIRTIHYSTFKLKTILLRPEVELWLMKLWIYLICEMF